MKTLKLNKDWDICLNQGGNLAEASDSYALAQTVACAVRAFTKDMYFNQTEGIPHFLTDLSNNPQSSKALLISAMEAEALKVPGVKSAQGILTKFENRILEGNLLLTLVDGENINVRI